MTSDPSYSSYSSRRHPSTATGSSRGGHNKGRTGNIAASPGFLNVVSAATTSVPKTIAEAPAETTDATGGATTDATGGTATDATGEAATDATGEATTDATGGGGGEGMNEWRRQGSRCDTVPQSESLKSEASSTSSGGGGSTGRQGEDAAVKVVVDGSVDAEKPLLQAGNGDLATTTKTTTTTRQPRRPSGEKPSKSSEGRSSRTQNLTPGRRESGSRHEAPSSSAAAKGDGEMHQQ